MTQTATSTPTFTPISTPNAPPSRYLVRTAQVPSYQPANHHHTFNQRLIGPETVGAQQMEVLLGTLHKGGGALPHAHPGIEQACYLLEGTARAEVAGEAFDMLPGDMCFFPADQMHVFTVTSDTPVKLLVIYSPPYGESPDKVIRPAAATTPVPATTNPPAADA